MPKPNSNRIAEAQRQRVNIQKKSEKYVSSTVYLQVLGSGAKGAPNTLYLFTDQKRYLFNCGECTQRLAHEHKVKLSRLDHIFITTKTWRNLGGLPGLSLTLQDVGVPNITLHGPEGLDELYNATKRFVTIKDMNVTMAPCSTTEDFEDNVMSVKYVLLGPRDDLMLSSESKQPSKRPRLDKVDKEYEEFMHDETDYYNRNINKSNRSPPRTAKARSSPEPSRKKTEKSLLEFQNKSHCSMAYICKIRKRPGTLDLAKCVERGVKPGPLLGQLKNGQDVVLPDGTTVFSKDVKTPDDPGPVFIVLEVPDISYLRESEFKKHFDDGINPTEEVPDLIVHYTPPQVLNDPKYRKFMSQFGTNCRHLILNEQNTCLGSEAVHRTQHKLHLLDPDVFPLLRDFSVPAEWNAQQILPKTDSPIRIKALEELKNKIALAQFQNILNSEGSGKGDGGQRETEDANSTTKIETIAGRTLSIYHLRPKKELDRSQEPKLHIQDYLQEAMDGDGFLTSLEQFKQLADGLRYKGSAQKEYPRVVFLGTGSSIPSKTRNVSAIFLQIDENRSMLLDCGEGTYGQLVRFFGPKRINSVMRTLRAVYVSHLHADHHIGLIGVMQGRSGAHAGASSTEPPRPLLLLAPGQIVSWLTLYDQLFERIRPDYTLIPNQNLLQDGTQSELTPAILCALGVESVKTCYVSHCPNAFGVAIQVNGDDKITYSGDTIPCDDLVKLGDNSSLLIHEATMEDELADEARIKMHSTTSQAIDIGNKMHARYTVLTHFSQRYARLPRLNAHMLHDNRNVGIAFDNMQITMNDLDLLPHMYAPLQMLFAEHCVEMELKAANRARQKERRSNAKSPLLQSVWIANSQLTGSSQEARRSDSSKSDTRHPRTTYRESNASRLRQESRGMAARGVVKELRSRSKSAASRSSSLASTQSRTSHRSDSPSPAKRAAVVVAASSRRSSSDSPSRKEDTVKKEPTSIKALASKGVIDSRSKTINLAPKASSQHTTDVEASVSSNASSDRTPSPKRNLPRRAPRQPSSDSERLRLNGSPLKQQKNSKDSPSCIQEILNSYNETIPEPKDQYPYYSDKCMGSSYSAKNELPTPTATRNVAISLLAHLIMWRFIHILKIIWLSNFTIPNVLLAIGIFFWTETKKNNSTADQTSKQSSYGNDVGRPVIKIPPMKTLRSPMPQTRNGRFAGPNPKETTYGSTKTVNSVMQKNGKIWGTDYENANRNCGKVSKQPKLDDIMSSCLLVTKKGAKNRMDVKLAISKPAPIDEKARKQLLIEAKTKFRTKKFWNDSKYEKIEGLNWISWG